MVRGDRESAARLSTLMSDSSTQVDGPLETGRVALPLMDRFFLGGVNDPYLSFHGFKDRAVPGNGSIPSTGAIAFSTFGSCISFEIPFIPVQGLRGMCFAQAGLVIPEIPCKREIITRSSVGLGVVLPLSSTAKLELTVSLPCSRYDEETQMIQFVFKSAG